MHNNVNYMKITCKQATYLISKNQETKLSLSNKLKLWFHVYYCTACKKFQQQTNRLSAFLSKNYDNIYNIKLSNSSKLKINEALNEEIKKV